PEAQLDRFLMHVRIGYPDADSEFDILNLARGQARQALNADSGVSAQLSESQVFAAREAVLDIHLAPALERYLVELVLASREPARYSEELARRIAFGASPRGTIALDRCARAFAWLEGRDFVTPADVHAVAADVLRHRVLVTFEAEAEGFTADRVVEELLDRVPLP
ncbi:MAG: MoxR family ATPase, partial [Xanthomonadales bacterium]|nr:MoxR family ATPase [Xanthomonadales bacterium]